jgi:DNA-directed RNA polymerase specialized sigma24 family protein
MTVSEAKDFEAHRSFLGWLSYRMLGSIAEGEDVVQGTVSFPPSKRR